MSRLIFVQAFSLGMTVSLVASAQANANQANVIEKTYRGGTVVGDLEGGDTIRGSSEYWRQRVASATTAGMGVGPYIGVGLFVQVGRHLNPDNVIEVKAYDASTSSSYRLVGAQLGLRHWFGNSVNTKVGVHGMSLSQRANNSISRSGPIEDQTVKGWIVSPSVSIGNQWQWESFTLGCDWLEVGVPVASRFSGTTATISEFDEGLMVTAFNLYMGAAI